MQAKVRNAFGKSPQGNMFKSANGTDAGFWKHLRALGVLNGDIDGFSAHETRFPNYWNKVLNSGTWAMQNGHPTKTRLTTAATQNGRMYGFTSLDLGSNSAFPFNVTAPGDIVWARVKVAIDNVANAQLLWGLSDSNDPFTAGAVTVANGILIHAAAGGQLSGRLVKASTSTTQALGQALTNGAFTTLGIIVQRSTDAVHFYVDDRLVFRQTTLTNLPLTTTNLGLLLAFNPETAAARTLDYKGAIAYQEAA